MTHPFYIFGRNTSRLLTRLLYGIKVTGAENAPKTGGFILASNHISYLDPPFVGSWIKREVGFFAKKELFDNWLLKQWLVRVNSIPVKRGKIDRRALQRATDMINDGYGLTIFPEGTRSKGDDFLPPKAGIGMMARQVGCPILPAYIHGADKLADCLKRKVRLSITYGELLSVEWVNSFSPDKEGYQKIANEIMDRIKQLKQKLHSD